MSAAARALRVSQPGISKAVRGLEEELQVELVRRTSRGVVPTAFGKTLFARARAAHVELEKAVQELSQAADGRAGSVAFGCGPVVADLVVPEAIRLFQAQYPRAEIRMVEGFAPNLVPPVREGTLDFAVGPRLPEFRDEHSVRFRPLFVHDRVVVGRRGHPLSRARALGELAGASWLTFEPRGLLESSFQELGVAAPAQVMHCESYIGFLRLLETTDMIGVVPRSTRPLSGDPLRIFEVREKLPGLTVGMFTRADSPLTAPAAALAKAVTSVARGLAARGRQPAAS
jgi:DNA-binding transcriptional LysR family regulator